MFEIQGYLLLRFKVHAFLYFLSGHQNPEQTSLR